MKAVEKCRDKESRSRPRRVKSRPPGLERILRKRIRERERERDSKRRERERERREREREQEERETNQDPQA